MKRVLLVTCYYPPDGSSSGVLRPLKFSKYLPRVGWVPHVLTMKEWMYSVKDNGLVQEIPPEVTIHRTFALDSGRHLAVKGRYLSLFAVPDRYVSWLPFGVVHGLRVIRSSGIHAIFSTSPPPTSHLIAASLKAASGLPWVADFRDPWLEEGSNPARSFLRHRFEAALERLIIRHANCLTVTTPNFRRDLLLRYPELGPEGVRVIYNGYDEMDFQNLERTILDRRFEILHAGLITTEFRDPFPLLRALATLINEGKIRRDEAKMTFLGGGSYLLSGNFSERVSQLELGGVVEVIERVSHREALQRQMAAAVLLLLQASEDTTSLIPAKAFEYLRSGRPILALTQQGATADLLKEMDACYVVDPADPSGLERAILSLYRLWQQPNRPTEIRRAISRYERSHLTAELAQLLEELTESSNFLREVSPEAGWF